MPARGDLRTPATQLLHRVGKAAGSGPCRVHPFSAGFPIDVTTVGMLGELQDAIELGRSDFVHPFCLPVGSCPDRQFYSIVLARGIPLLEPEVRLH
jgi:hypothetical protein